jgi:hypothetical protein
MKTNIKTKKTLIHTILVSMFCCAFTLTSMGNLAFAQQLNRGEAVDTNDSRAQIWAGETGVIAGGANFCKIDPELIESYISRAQARIASESRSDVELVVARITFSNTMNTSSISEPEGGCEDFADRFDRENIRLD